MNVASRFSLPFEPYIYRIYTVTFLDNDGIVPYYEIKDGDRVTLPSSIGDAGSKARGVYRDPMQMTLCARPIILPLVLLAVSITLLSLTATRAAAAGPEAWSC